MDEMMLDRLLTRAAPDIAYPPTPELRARVVAAIRPAPHVTRGTSSGFRRPMRPAIGLGAIVIALGVALTLAVPSSRSAVADFFGIEGSKIERLPTPGPGVTPTPFPTPAGIQSFATPASLIAIQEQFDVAPALLAGDAGAPSIYTVQYFDTLAIVLSYSRLDLWEVRLQAGGTFNKGESIDPIIAKSISGGTKITDLTVSGRPATWISGGAHIVRFTDRDGNEAAASVRTVERNTLIWRTEAAFYRIETDLTLDEARRLAESLP